MHKSNDFDIIIFYRGNENMVGKMIKIIFILYIIIMVGLCLVGIFIPAGKNTWEKGATIYYPFEDSVVGSEFSVNGNVYSKDTIENIEILISPIREIVVVQREQIEYNGQVLHTLSSFKVPIKIAEDGEYEITIVITDSTGTHNLDTVAFTVEAGIKPKAFAMFSAQHLLTLLVVALCYVVMILIYKKSAYKKTKNMLYAIICIAVIICDITVKLWLLKNGVFKASYDAFLHMCDIAGPLLLLLCYMKDSKKRRVLYSMMFIWGILGASMALLTPELRGYGFFSFYFFNFFIKHGIIVIAVMLISAIEGYKPKMKHLPLVIALSIVIVGIIYLINAVIINVPPYELGNYMFLSYPPTGGSAIDILVDIFGPSPNYIIGMALLAAGLYSLFCLIFLIGEKIKSLTHKS